MRIKKTYIFSVMVLIFTVIKISESKLAYKLITSKNYPSPYSYSYFRDNVHHYSDSKANRIRILINDVDLSPHDSLTISDGYDDCTRPLKRFTGSLGRKYFPMMLFSISEKICLTFNRYQGGRGVHRGYHIEIFEFPRCNGDLTDEYGDIVSPNYNYVPYKSGLNCQWRIRAKPGQAVRYNVEEFQVSCAGGDDVAISGGVGSLCNRHRILATDTFLSKNKNGVSSLKLKTNVAAKGFWIKYKMVGCPDPNLLIDTRSYGTATNPADYYYTGYNLEYRCPTGYVYNDGDNTMILTCRNDSNWRTNRKASAKCRPVDCGDPGTPVNARRRFSSGYRYQSTVTYTCTSDEYELRGRSKRVCQANGQWSGDLPQCEAKESQKPTGCYLPEDPNNGYKIGNDTSVGSVLTFECHLGYTLKGQDSIECYETGEWSWRVPECKIVTCPEPVVPANGFIHNHDDSLHSQHVYSDFIEYDCQVGYQLRSTADVTSFSYCTRFGNWSNPNPECEAITCDPPTVPQNGRALYDTLKYGSETRYECNAGYKVDGAMVSRCTENGWSSTVPMCHPVPCPTIKNDTLLNAHIAPPYREHFHYGHTISVVCEPGFRLTDQATMTSILTHCTKDGTWSYDVTAGCQYELLCKNLTDLDLPTNTRLLGYTGNNYGDTVYVDCDGSGASPVTAECLGDGEWSKDPFTICTATGGRDPDALAVAERARKDKETRDMWMWIIIGIVFASILVVSVIAFIIVRRRRRQRRQRPPISPDDNEYDNPVYGVGPNDDKIIMGSDGTVGYSKPDDRWRQNPTFKDVEQTLERPDSLLFEEEDLYGNAGQYAQAES